ncbi:unnamed protein product [Amoebophrya sp. A120]|nr:unnamed protein product [Amoebophrya sp. A120]|eukprot:GSA120T00024036001.1
MVAPSPVKIGAVTPVDGTKVAAQVKAQNEDPAAITVLFSKMKISGANSIFSWLFVHPLGSGAAENAAKTLNATLHLPAETFVANAIKNKMVQPWATGAWNRMLAVVLVTLVMGWYPIIVFVLPNFITWHPNPEHNFACYFVGNLPMMWQRFALFPIPHLVIFWSFAVLRFPGTTCWNWYQRIFHFVWGGVMPVIYALDEVYGSPLDEYGIPESSPTHKLVFTIGLVISHLAFFTSAVVSIYDARQARNSFREWKEELADQLLFVDSNVGVIEDETIEEDELEYLNVNSVESTHHGSSVFNKRITSPGAAAPARNIPPIPHKEKLAYYDDVRKSYEKAVLVLSFIGLVGFVCVVRSVQLLWNAGVGGCFLNQIVGVTSVQNQCHCESATLWSCFFMMFWFYVGSFLPLCALDTCT